jgi:hypothetical protein
LRATVYDLRGQSAALPTSRSLFYERSWEMAQMMYETQRGVSEVINRVALTAAELDQLVFSNTEIPELTREGAQSEPRIAAICRAILDPNLFNNYRFWYLMYKKKFEKEFAPFAELMSFKNGVDNEYFLGKSGSMDYFARYPDLEEVIEACIRARLPIDQTKEILLSCSYISVRPRQFLAKVDEGYRHQYLNVEHLRAAPQTTKNIVGRDISFKDNNASIFLKVLSIFMGTLGAVALVLALTTLSASAAAMSAVAGVASLAGSYGLFKYANNLPQSAVMDEELPRTYPRSGGWY